MLNNLRFFFCITCILNVCLLVMSLKYLNLIQLCCKLSVDLLLSLSEFKIHSLHTKIESKIRVENRSTKQIFKITITLLLHDENPLIQKCCFYKIKEVLITKQSYYNVWKIKIFITNFKS